MATSTGSKATRAQPNGVLPVASIAVNPPKTAAVKSAGPRLKVVVRRLAPALTEMEFLNILGNDWKVGQGRVDWFMYKPGKDSKDASKQSRPSRAYLHLTSDAHLVPLSEAVRSNTFDDAQNTWNSPALVGPPVVEFAPYGRVAQGRKRVDARAGTIDQDPEFMDFLESLINPVSTKEDADDAGGNAPLEKGQKVTTTPLVQFLKDKKAKKSKDAEVAKSSKHGKQDIKAIAKKEAILKAEDGKKGGNDGKKKEALEKASKEAVKVLTREAANKGGNASHGGTAESAKGQRAPVRERGSIAAAARILQRDLGLSPGNAHRRAKANAVDTTKTSTDPVQASPGPSSPKVSATNRGKNTSSATSSTASPAPVQATPVLLLKKPAASGSFNASTPVTNPTNSATQATASKSQPAARKQALPPIPSPGSTRAFIKHANPSQGITEPLLKSALEAFGPIKYLEIDKRKGFAYVDFETHEGLKAAMKESTVKIAQGGVQILERKDKDVRPAQGASSGIGGGGGGGGGPRGGMSGANGGFGRGGRGGTVGRRGARGNSGPGGRGGASQGAAAASASGVNATTPSTTLVGPAAGGQ